MKFFTTFALALSLLATSSFAGVCRDQFEAKFEERKGNSGGAAISGFFVSGMTAMVGLPLIGAPIMVGAGTYFLIWGKKPQRLVKLIDQAEVCRGSYVSKAYKAYSKSHDNGLTKQEFCQEIVNGDVEGTLCAAGEIPTLKQVGKYYIE